MNILYETPWWLLAGLAVIGGVLFWTGRGRAEKRLIYAGLGTLLLALVMGITSWVLDSPREKAIKGTRALVAAVLKRDRDAMRPLMHEQINTPFLSGREAVIKRADELVATHNVTDASILDIEAAQEGKRVIVTMRLAVTISGMTVPSDWELKWEEVNKQWVLRDADPAGERREDVKKAIGRR